MELTVNLPRPADESISDRFPLVRKGYERETVDRFAQTAVHRITALQERCETLISENAQLVGALGDARLKATEVDFSALGGRAQEILRVAEEQARDVTRQAGRDAEQMIAQAQAEVDQLTERTTAELGEVRRTHLSELKALRAQGERDAAELPRRAGVESEQLLTSARLQAASVCAEADATARGIGQAALLEAQSRTATAENQAAGILRETAEQRDRLLGELRQAQDAANATIKAMLTEATALQRAMGEHLAAETDQAAALRTQSLAEAEQAKVEAANEAEQIISRSQQRAALIDERARQEFAWRRRQMQHEQDLLDRRKVAMLSQLSSLSALAAESAENFSDMPELSFGEMGGPDEYSRVDPTGDGEQRQMADAVQA
jgi:cell division septum initiation protein DivIVA